MKSFIISLLLLTAFTVSAQQKKPSQKTPAKSTPAKKIEPSVPQGPTREEIEKKIADSLEIVIKQKIEAEHLEKLRQEEESKKQAELKKQRTEAFFKQDREQATMRSQQTERQKKQAKRESFSFNIKLGGTLSTLTTSELGNINKENIKALAFGLGASLPITKFISINPEINYMKKGIGYKYNHDYERLYMNYITLPILLGVDVIKTPSLKTVLKVGGYGGYWLSGKYTSKIDNESSSSKYDFDTDFSDGFKDERLDYGICAALKQEFRVYKNYKVFIEGRYDYGLKSISKYEDNIGITTPMHKTISLWLGLQL